MDKNEFIEIIKEHQKLIYKVCHSYCSNPQEHKDLEQEILLQLWKSMNRYDGRAKLSTWIYKVALNTAIVFYRKNEKHRVNKAEWDHSIISLRDEGFDPEKEDQLAILHKFINQLNANNKALILLYLDGYKYSEIAEIVGISASNVGTKINRIKSSLKEKIQDIIA